MTTSRTTVTATIHHFLQQCIETFALDQPFSKWKEEDAKVLHQLVADLNEYKKSHLTDEWAEDIVFEVQMSPEDETLELVVSANGSIQTFPFLLLFEAAQKHFTAPKIRAFRNKMLNMPSITMGDVTVDSAQLQVQLLVSETFLDLRVGFPVEMTEENFSSYQQLAYILIDHQFGEWEAAVKVASVEACHVEDLDPEEGAIYAFSDIVVQVDNLWKTFGFNATYPSAEMEYVVGQTYSKNADPEGEPDILITLNRSAAELVGSQTYMQRITLLGSAAHYEVLSNLEEELSQLWANSPETSATYQAGIWTHRITDLAAQECIMEFYVKDPEPVVQQVDAYLRQHLGDDHGCSMDVAVDPAWMQYRMIG